MMLFAMSLLIFATAMALMAIGVLIGRRPLAGGCGRSCSCEGRR